jgi:hypothetical protein
MRCPTRTMQQDRILSMSVKTHTQTHTHAQTHIHRRTHSCTNTHTQSTLTHTHTPTHTLSDPSLWHNTLLHKHTHPKHINTHTYTHTHSLRLEPVAQSVGGSDCRSEGMGYFLCPSEQTRLFWWFRVVGSLPLHQLVRWCQYNVTSRP